MTDRRMTGPALLSLKGIGKRFPGVVANADVDLEIESGSIHALLGENGAGKSTLVKMIYGVLKPDEGEMLLAGAAFRPQRPADARAVGIGMVFQHFSLFDAMSVEENIALALPPAAARGDLAARIRDISATYGLHIDPQQSVAALSAGEKQRVEIVRCLLQSPRLLIMDEPTSVLTPQEADRLFSVLRQLRDNGCAVLYISHKLDEIRALCDTATILRRGEVVATCDPREETKNSLAAMMIGQDLLASNRAPGTAGPLRLSVQGLGLPAPDQIGVSLEDISFSIRGGEVFGIAGVAGNGQTELLAALTGEARCSARAIALDGEEIGHFGPTRRRARRMAFVPEDRLGHGAVAGMTLTENTLISVRGSTQVSRGFLRLFGAARFAGEIVQRFKVVAAGTNAAAGSLSGGNLQKFIVGREVMQQPIVLIVAQPTWGVDAGSAADIHAALADLAAHGTAVLIISQDLDELRQNTDRLAVLFNGRLSATHRTADLSVEQIGRMMGGELDLNAPATEEPEVVQ